MIPAQAALFPTYPSAAGELSPGNVGLQPAGFGGRIGDDDISAFAPNFQTPYTEQANLTVQHEFGRNIVATVSYAYVHGVHEIRSLDVNLPPPTIRRLSRVQRHGSVFLGMYGVDVLQHLADHAVRDLPLSSLHQSRAAARSAAGRHQFLSERQPAACTTA